jgi:pilus assembly protein CpaC
MGVRAALILFVAVAWPSVVYAQPPARITTVAAVESGGLPVEPATDSVRLLVGRSTIVDVGKPVARLSLTSADIADALVTSPNELLVNGKAPGAISMFVWDRAGAIRRYEVVVQRDLARLTEQMKQLFPLESVDIRANGKSIVLSGTVSSKDAADKMASLAGSFVDAKDELVSLLQIAATGRSNQVLLRVRFAEVNRSALTELGVGLFTSPTGVNNTLGRVTTQQFSAPGFDQLKSTKDSSSFGSPVTSASGQFTFSDFLNLFLYSEKFDIGAMVRALQSKGLFQSLAEPNLIAESGKEASFLAGGEFPIPIAQASGGGTSISVQFKEFGIRLTFTPVVIGNRVHLKVRPEVSALDFSNAVTLQGFRIPALTTRRTETEIELNDGQTFAIAGLLNNTMTSTLQKVPGIGDIPVLGLLFKSKAAQKSQTELVVMITPEILPNNSPGVTSTLPRLVEPYLPPISQKLTVDPPPPAFVSATPNAQKSADILRADLPGRTGPIVHVDTWSAKPAGAAAAVQEPSKPLTARQQKDLDRAQQQEQEATARIKADEMRLLARQAKDARAQAERDAKAAKKQTALDAAAAKKQAELEKQQHPSN